MLEIMILLFARIANSTIGQQPPSFLASFRVLSRPYHDMHHSSASPSTHPNNNQPLTSHNLLSSIFSTFILGALVKTDKQTTISHASTSLSCYSYYILFSIWRDTTTSKIKEQREYLATNQWLIVVLYTLTCDDMLHLQ